MTTYKQQLLRSLTDDGWEQTEVNNDDHDWWCDEHWCIRSVRKNWGLEALIFFLVDPQWEGPRKKGQGIREITATKAFPKDWIGDDDRIASLDMSKGQFDTKLHEFVVVLGDYKRNIQTS